MTRFVLLLAVVVLVAAGDRGLVRALVEVGLFAAWLIGDAACGRGAPGSQVPR